MTFLPTGFPAPMTGPNSTSPTTTQVALSALAADDQPRDVQAAAGLWRCLSWDVDKEKGGIEILEMNN